MTTSSSTRAAKGCDARALRFAQTLLANLGPANSCGRIPRIGFVLSFSSARLTWNIPAHFGGLGKRGTRCNRGDAEDAENKRGEERGKLWHGRLAHADDVRTGKMPVSQLKSLLRVRSPRPPRLRGCILSCARDTHVLRLTFDRAPVRRSARTEPPPCATNAPFSQIFA